jgi:CheY-like chemotaxis protein
MLKILVIEDENLLSDLLKKFLTRDGHQVLIANDGVEGIKIYYQFRPDLIITDIIMPEKDGIEVIVEVLKDNPELPIIAISGGRRAVTADFNLDSAEMLGVKGILQKPFTHEQLQELIESVLVV